MFQQARPLSRNPEETEMATQSTPGLGPDLRQLYRLFPGNTDEPAMETVPADAVPEPYHRLLVHEHHMTVTVEAHHGKQVELRVLDRRHEPPWYGRKILLVLEGTERVVQFGIMRINLDLCSEAVRAAILREDTPLGHILIQHNVLRRIEPTAFLRITPNREMMAWFGLVDRKQTYGRLAYIHCDGKPAVELLEVVTPE